MISHPPKEIGSRVPLTQTLFGYRSGQFWAIFRDPETLQVIGKYPMIGLVEGEAVEMSVEFVAAVRDRVNA
jgi:hypothetical protein